MPLACKSPPAPRIGLIALTLALLLGLTQPAWARVWHVDAAAGGSGSGTSWSRAFRTIGEALEVVQAFDQIWVMHGVYALSETLAPDVPVAIYGGFTGQELGPAQRDLRANPTVIDGGGATLCFYVTEGPVILDGLIIRNGSDGSGMYPGVGAGGIYVEGARLILRHCTLAEHTGSICSAVTARQASLLMLGCTFADNTVDYPTGGGALDLDESRAVILRCGFARNTRTDGGAILVRDGASALVAHSIFQDNAARFCGGAIRGSGKARLDIVGCTFHRNSVSVAGGALCGGAMHVVNSRFLDNQGQFGGAILASGASIINCVFTGNTGDDSVVQISGSIMTHCTLTGNTALVGPVIQGYEAARVYNSIVWGNGFSSIAAGAVDGATAEHSDIEGGHPGLGNIDADPRLAAPQAWNFHLTPGSPCIDAARFRAPGFPYRDFEGDRRIIGPAPDMGADELRPAG